MNHVRIRIKCKNSVYFNKIGYILYSNCNGTFHIKVYYEGNPEIDINAEDVEPC